MKIQMLTKYLLSEQISNELIDNNYFASPEIEYSKLRQTMGRPRIFPIQI